MKRLKKLRAQIQEASERVRLEERIGEQSNGPRFCSRHSHSFRLNEGSHLFYFSDDQTSHVLPRDLSLLLQWSRTLRTLDEHAYYCVKVLERNGERRPSVERVLNGLSQLADSGLLISEPVLLDRWRKSAKDPVTGRITTIGVATSNRVESLERCLRSYIKHTKKFDRDNDFVVMDDSASPNIRIKTKEMLTSLRNQYDVSIYYAGWEEKTQFIRALAAVTGVERELISFGLVETGDQEFSAGKNRNALFLHTVGDLFFSADDDSLCELVRPRAPMERNNQASALQVIDHWFFPSLAEALEAVAAVDEDLLATHERLLGRTLAACLSTFGSLDLLQTEHPVSQYLAGMESNHRVRVTLNGVLGDSGLRIPAPYNILSTASRRRLNQTSESYESAFRSREVMRLVPDYQITDHTWFVSTALAYDNRYLLPPFFPMCRGHDGIFADTLRCSDSHAFFANVPLAVMHVPAVTRVYDAQETTSSAVSSRMSSLLAACISAKQFSIKTDSVEDRMRSLGRHLVDVGKLNADDFREFIRLNVWRVQSGLVRSLEHELSQYKDPPLFWIRDRQSYFARVQQVLTADDYVVPGDLAENRSSLEALDLAQRWLGRFGELLCVWPELIEGAKQLRQSDQRLGKYL